MQSVTVFDGQFFLVAGHDKVEVGACALLHEMWLLSNRAASVKRKEELSSEKVDGECDKKKNEKKNCENQSMLLVNTVDFLPIYHLQTEKSNRIL